MAHSMDRKNSPEPMAGGGPLALLMIAGVFVGGFMGQPSIGLLAGTGLGIVVAIAIWLRTRAR